MMALSIRQPWASLILKARKDIENRCWPTKVRGRILIHAAKGMTRVEHGDAIAFAVDAIRSDRRNAGAGKTVTLRELGFAFDELPRGGIVGSVEIVDCVRQSDSPWFVGDYGFVLRDPRPLPFTPLNGQLGFFDVPGAWDADGVSETSDAAQPQGNAEGIANELMHAVTTYYRDGTINEAELREQFVRILSDANGVRFDSEASDGGSNS